MNESRLGKVQLIAAMALSGTIGVFVQESNQTAFNVVFYRCVFGALFLGLFAQISGLLNFKLLSKKDWILILSGGAAIVFNWYFLFESYSYASIGMTTVAYHTQPFFVLAIAMFFLNERIESYKFFWVVMAFSGLTLIANPFGETGYGPGYMIGIVLSVVAAILYAIATVIAKQLKHVKAHMTVVIQMTLGAALLYPFATLSEVPLVGPHWYWLLGLGLIHTCIMYVLMYSSYQKLPTSMIAVLSYIYPVVAITADYFVYGHAMSVIQMIGMFLILFSGFAVNRGINPLRYFQAKPVNPVN